MINQKSRVVSGALAIMILAVAVMGFKCTRRVTGTVTCPIGQRCTIGISGQIEWRPGSSLQSESEEIANRVFILDLAKPWQADSGFTPQGTINVSTDTGQVSETFPLSLAPAIAQTIDPVDKDTIPQVFVFDNPTAVRAFVDTSASRSTSPQPVTTTDATFAITQIDCTAPSGKYVNHVRYQDATGISYVNTTYLIYTAPTNPNAGCNQGQISIVE